MNEKVGVVKVRLFRPFAADELLKVIPATAKRIAVMDRTKEPGADGEPLYKDVVTALSEAYTGGTGKFAALPRVVGGRYGLSSKEFTPGMVKGVFDELKKDQPKNHFTIGIFDDLSHSSLEWDEDFRTDAGNGVMRCMFYGLGSDGTVGANKNTIKIMGEETELYGQGYFVYDSKKAGAATISHLRFSPRPIHSPYLIGNNEANFIGCHQPVFLDRYELLDHAADRRGVPGQYSDSADKVWHPLTRRMQQQIMDKKIEFYVIDAYQIAKQTGMGNRINTIMQTCFFAISGVLPRDVAIAKIKLAAKKSYSKKGSAVVEANWKAIDETIANLHKVAVPATVSSTHEMPEAVPAFAPEFVRKITAEIMSGRGDRLPVSALPNDGTWPSGTAMWDKRNLAQEIPVWDEELCIHCGKCPFVCPHSAIRSKLFSADMAKDAPPTFKHVQVKGKDFEQGMHISYQVAPEDCTGCTLCVDICPAVSKVDGHKALEMRPMAPLREQERANFDFFLTLPEYDRTLLKTTTIKGAMMMQPLFEFPSACVGCGETSYIRLASQLFGDRMVVANATGCSSIYGGNLPTTPYCKNGDGRGPAWSNSLFEDNAEFGLGFRVSIDKHAEHAGELLQQLKDKVGNEFTEAILNADQSTEAGIHQQRERVEELRQKLAGIDICRSAPTGKPGRIPGEEKRVDHRRRRLGLRHRFRRSRPCHRDGPQRQYPGARHRGLFEYRRADVQGHAARRDREIRRRRQAHRQEGSGADRDELWTRLRRACGLRREGYPHAEGVPRGGILRRTVADHRLQPLRRARLRLGPAAPATGTGGQDRPLAAVPLRSAAQAGRPESAVAGFAEAFRALPRVHQERAALPRSVARDG